MQSSKNRQHFGQSMNRETNEPVAWMWRMKDSDNKWELIFNKPINDDQFFETIPLYTHPAKTLTDEEIVSCIDESEPDTTDMIRFAKAILKKASEK